MMLVEISGYSNAHVYNLKMKEPPFLLADKLRYGEPAWRIALLFPPQGSWSEDDYLTLDAGRQIEFDCGFVEVLNTLVSLFAWYRKWTLFALRHFIKKRL